MYKRVDNLNESEMPRRREYVSFLEREEIFDSRAFTIEGECEMRVRCYFRRREMIKKRKTVRLSFEERNF